MIVSKDFYTPPLPYPAALRGVVKRYKSIPFEIMQKNAARYTFISSGILYQIDRILFQSVGKSSISFMNGSSTLGKCLFLGSVQFQLNHFFNTVFTQYTRYAYAEVFLPVLAFQQSAARNHTFLVAQYGLYHEAAAAPGAYHADVPSNPVNVAPPTIVSAATFCKASSLRNSVTGIPL